MAHTIVNDDKETKAYIIAGYNGEVVLKECFVLDISNLKFSLFGLLNQKREFCGAFKRDKLLWVYGGY